MTRANSVLAFCEVVGRVHAGGPAIGLLAFDREGGEFGAGGRRSSLTVGRFRRALFPQRGKSTPPYGKVQERIVRNPGSSLIDLSWEAFVQRVSQQGQSMPIGPSVRSYL